MKRLFSVVSVGRLTGTTQVCLHIRKRTVGARRPNARVGRFSQARHISTTMGSHIWEKCQTGAWNIISGNITKHQRMHTVIKPKAQTIAELTDN